MIIVAAWGGLALLLALTRWLPGQWNMADLQYYWWFLGAVMLVIAALDGLPGLRKSAVSVQRSIREHQSLGQWNNVELTISHNFKTPTAIAFIDHAPVEGACQPEQHELLLRPGYSSKTQYRFCPQRRGPQAFSGFWIRYPSRLRFWTFQDYKTAPTQVRVYPNYAATQNLALLNLDQQMNQVGARRQQRRGQGAEFHQLRPFRQGDAMRQIHWKATAKHRKLISMEYQDETHQEILFMLDCGRKMRSVDDDLTYFDHALNSLLLLAYMALKQGDATGCLTFSGTQRWLPPLSHTNNMAKLLNHVYDLETSTSVSDYTGAAENLLARQKKRALVIFITNVSDENLTDISAAVSLLQNKHLVMVANLEEPVLQRVSHKEVTTFDDALSYLGAQHHLERRKITLQKLRKQGVIAFDCTPAKLTQSLISQYIAVKRSGLL